jgi:hypothetical protein
LAERLRQRIANPSLGNRWIGSTPILPAKFLEQHMSKYYHYTTGRYALVDVYYRNIWINLHDEVIAHEIKSVFLPKTITVVYDLSTFHGWHDSLVDSECCLDWKLSPADKISASSASLNSLYLHSTQKLNNDIHLINEKTTDLLTNDRRLELQMQMLMYKRILEITKLHIPIPYNPDSWFNNDLVDPNILRHEHYAEIYNIFSAEIHAEEIEKKLYQFANTAAEKNIRTGSAILKIIGKLYA